MLTFSPTYLRCGVTLNFDDYGKKERRASAGAVFIGDQLNALVERIISLYARILDGTKRNGGS
jgi:hypothetical protein